MSGPKSARGFSINPAAERAILRWQAEEAERKRGSGPPSRPTGTGIEAPVSGTQQAGGTQTLSSADSGVEVRKLDFDDQVTVSGDDDASGDDETKVSTRKALQLAAGMMGVDETAGESGVPTRRLGSRKEDGAK